LRLRGDPAGGCAGSVLPKLPDRLFRLPAGRVLLDRLFPAAAVVFSLPHRVLYLQGGFPVHPAEKGVGRVLPRTGGHEALLLDRAAFAHPLPAAPAGDLRGIPAYSDVIIKERTKKVQDGTGLFLPADRGGFPV